MVPRSADSERPPESLSNSEGDRHLAFIRQSSRSNYCGVYSTGMLLSLLGYSTSRRKALALFNLKRSNADYAGATLADICSVVIRAVGVHPYRWEHYPRFDFTSISEALGRQLKIDGRPTLLSFGAIHKNGVWKCRHVAVVIRASNKMIELLDPLGNSRGICASVNVRFQPAQWPQPISVIGSSYRINVESEAAVLRWAAKEHHA